MSRENEMHLPPENQEGKMNYEQALILAEQEINNITSTLQEGESFPGSKACRALLRAEALNQASHDEALQDMILQIGELKEAYANTADKDQFTVNIRKDLEARLKAIRNPIKSPDSSDVSL